MLTELCKELNNWFCKREDKLFGTFTIEDGQLTIDGAQSGQYYRICDSVFNDGVYQYPTFNLKDETFDGAIWLMRVPDEVINLSSEIDKWKDEYEDVIYSPLASETVGGYSRTLRSSGSGSSSGNGARWQTAFADQLSHWRKL